MAVPSLFPLSLFAFSIPGKYFFAEKIKKILPLSLYDNPALVLWWGKRKLLALSVQFQLRKIMEMGCKLYLYSLSRDIGRGIMEYKMIVRRTMFAFTQTKKGGLKLASVKFLSDSIMKKKNNLLLVNENDEVQFFIGGSTPVAELSREQFCFVAAATKFFGYLPDQKQLPVWLWAATLDMSNEGRANSGYERWEERVEAACC